MILLAIDPGSALSALVWFDTITRTVLRKCKVPNDEALPLVAAARDVDHLAIEMAESFGAKVWDQVFVTVFWSGRIVQSWGREYTLVTRREVKLEIAGSPSAKDGQIRNVLLERWGGSAIALGTKKARGPLHGVTADLWQALAIAVVFADRQPGIA